MNQAQSKLIYATLLSLSTFFFVWTNPFSSSTVLSQTGLIPAPSLQQEQPELLTSESSIPAEVQSAVLNDAVKQTSKTVSALEITEAKPQEWSDGCLGLGKPDEICTQAITPGWEVVVTDGLRNWTYRTDNVGDTVRLEEFEGSGEVGSRK